MDYAAMLRMVSRDNAGTGYRPAAGTDLFRRPSFGACGKIPQSELLYELANKQWHDCELMQGAIQAKLGEFIMEYAALQEL
jgi:hypothetical protein